jgi:hypothetical protein
MEADFRTSSDLEKDEIQKMTLPCQSENDLAQERRMESINQSI